MDKFKTVEIDGNTYRIQKFDVVTATVLMGSVIGKILTSLPQVIGGVMGEDDELDTQELLAALGMLFEKLSEEEIRRLMKTCLTHCYRVLSAGDAPIMRENGTFGVEDAEYDGVLTMKLCFEAVKFGLSVFFKDGFQSLGAETMDTFLQKLKDMTSSSSPRLQPDSGATAT